MARIASGRFFQHEGPMIENAHTQRLYATTETQSCINTWHKHITDYTLGKTPFQCLYTDHVNSSSDTILNKKMPVKCNKRQPTSQHTSQTSRIASVSTTEASTSLAEGNRYSGKSILNQSCSLKTQKMTIYIFSASHRSQQMLKLSWHQVLWLVGLSVTLATVSKYGRNHSHNWDKLNNNSKTPD